jgi:hypothetical protein
MKDSIKDTPIEFFDTNFWIGENNLSEKYTTNNNNAMKAIADRAEKYNITYTLVNHFNSLFCSPETGNNILADFLKQANGLINNGPGRKNLADKNNADIKDNPNSADNSNNSENKPEKFNCFGVLFMEFDYFKGPGIFKSLLKKRYDEGFMCIRLLPKSHKYPFEATLLKHIYQVLDDCRFPVIISIDEMDITGDKYIEWMKILHVAGSFGNMPIIIDGGNSKELMFNSYIYLLIQNSSNIYFNTHNLFGLGQIENIASFGGSGRLIFDSYFPFYETFLSVDRILEADLPVKEKRYIASLNMKNIIDNIKI